MIDALIRYPGSKGTLSKRYLPHLPGDTERLNYHEPFVGSGAMFRRVVKSGIRFRSYHLSDSFDWLVRFHRAVRGDVTDWGDIVERLREARIRLLPENEHRYSIYLEFDRSRQRVTDGDYFAFMFLCQYAKGQYIGPHRRDVASFGHQYVRGGISTVTPQKVLSWRDALKLATVKRADVFDILPSLGSRDFAYLDPTYINGPDGEPPFRMYEKEFTADDQRKFCELLKGAQFRFMLSMGDRGLVWEWYMRDRSFRTPFRNERGFHCIPVLRTREGRRSDYPSYFEWLILNYDPPLRASLL